MVEKVYEFPSGFPLPHITKPEYEGIITDTESAGLGEDLTTYTDKLAQLLLGKFDFKNKQEGAKAYLEGLKGSSASKLVAGVVDTIGTVYRKKAESQGRKAGKDMLKAEKKRAKAGERKEVQLKKAGVEAKRKVERLEIKARSMEDLLKVKGPSLRERARSIIDIFRKSPEKLGEKATTYEGRAGGHEVKANQFKVLSELLIDFAKALRSEGKETEPLLEAKGEAQERLSAANLSLQATGATEKEIVDAMETLQNELARRAGELPVAPITPKI